MAGWLPGLLPIENRLVLWACCYELWVRALFLYMVWPQLLCIFSLSPPYRIRSLTLISHTRGVWHRGPVNGGARSNSAPLSTICTLSPASSCLRGCHLGAGSVLGISGSLNLCSSSQLFGVLPTSFCGLTKDEGLTLTY